ncbi:hypothetical protein HQ447_17435 [bacterium]|nr:hypothetical protein [bacterium]
MVKNSDTMITSQRICSTVIGAASRLGLPKCCGHAFVAILLLLGESASAAVSAIYSINAPPTQNAFFRRSSGNAGADRVMTWQQFKPSVELATTLNLGGVINFENANDVSGRSLISPAVGNSLGFRIVGSDFQIRNRFSLADQTGPFPSGVNVLSSSFGSILKNEFRFTGFGFSAPGNLILTQAGFILIGDRFDDVLQAEITATFSGGGTLTLDSNLRSAGPMDRIFYGFKAPTGESIVSIRSNFGGTRIVILDDFGFVAVPESSTCGLMALGVALLFRRHRAPRETAPSGVPALHLP